MGTKQGGIRAPSPDPLLGGRGRIAEPRPAPEGVLVGGGVASETVRAAQITRLSMSRPSGSVPSR